MQAMIYRRYGGPEALRLETVAQPHPGPDDVLVRVHASSLNAADAYLLRGEPALMRLSFGMRGPKRPILGVDIAGEVTAVGNRVTRFQPGDAVYGDLSGCGLGGFAEYVCAPADVLALKPARLSYAQAAAVPLAGVTALQGLRAAGPIGAGQAVLIHGASGGVGTFAIQLAKAFRATVTAVCSPRNVELAQQLGADHVIDYTQEDFVQGGRRYDVVLVANGKRKLAEYRRALRQGGRCIIVGGAIPQIMAATLFGPLWSIGGASVQALMAQPSRSDLELLNDLFAAGAVTPVIDRCFPLAELPEALHYRAAGRARGKIVITIGATPPGSTDAESNH